MSKEEMESMQLEHDRLETLCAMDPTFDVEQGFS
jgi:hypothetical protein